MGTTAAGSSLAVLPRSTEPPSPGDGRPNALRRWPTWLRAVAVVLAIGLGMSGLTACGNNDPEQISRPVDDAGHTLYGPVVNGVAYCSYVLTADECKDATEPNGTPIPAEHWVKTPSEDEARAQGQSVDRHDDSNLAWQLLQWGLIYHLWFGSPAYYGRFYPAGSPLRGQYTSTISDRDARFGRSYGAYESRARYQTTSGKVVTGDKVSARNFTTRNSGGDKGKGGTACVILGFGSRPGLPDLLGYATSWSTAGQYVLIAVGAGGPVADLVVAKGSSGGKSGGGSKSGGSKSKTTTPGNIGGDKGTGRSQTGNC